MNFGLYLCGCNPAAKRNYSGDVTPQGIYTDRRFDSEGYEVCPEHGERLYGWKAVPTSDDAGFRPDFSSKATGKLGELDFSGPDVRDNRDPEEVFAERMREKAALTNGHGG